MTTIAATRPLASFYFRNHRLLLLHPFILRLGMRRFWCTWQIFNFVIWESHCFGWERWVKAIIQKRLPECLQFGQHKYPNKEDTACSISLTPETHLSNHLRVHERFSAIYHQEFASGWVMGYCTSRSTPKALNYLGPSTTECQDYLQKVANAYLAMIFHCWVRLIFFHISCNWLWSSIIPNENCYALDFKY